MKIGQRDEFIYDKSISLFLTFLIFKLFSNKQNSLPLKNVYGFLSARHASGCGRKARINGNRLTCPMPVDDGTALAARGSPAAATLVRSPASMATIDHHECWGGTNGMRRKKASPRDEAGAVDGCTATQKR
ncbi:hypothetical protein [Paucidesulfovibrio gracilis]|uniref:hypothetical protein n=1 Tax=Paucidesulfovibrio gracilis TaxID=47158 RepID=UPI0009990DCD|nr:hypothetical protein [Paucidesulfovibrio gracilis]